MRCKCAVHRQANPAHADDDEAGAGPTREQDQQADWDNGLGKIKQAPN